MNLFPKINFASLWEKPRHLYSRFKNGDAKNIFREQILGTNESNLKLALAIGFGIFMSIFPIWGFQTIVALFLAAFFKLNKPIVIVATSVSIPPIIPLYLYASFFAGGLVTGHSTNINFSNHFSFENIQKDLFQYYIGAVVFSILMGILLTTISYIVLSLFRKEQKIHPE